MKIILQIVALAAVAVVAVFVLNIAKTFGPKGAIVPAATSSGAAVTAQNHSDAVTIDVPQPGSAVSSPLTFSGSAPGSWYFEASFPVTVVDWDGRIIGQSHAEAQGDWMTTSMVPFSGSVDFTPPQCAASQDYCRRGSVIFKNDNPSGDPSRDKAIEVPVVFK
ncbi:MAG: hypothetical protein KGI49_02030 [Patescibacteria group bacterium]|nr:hypothetical protein [Patescibacteria group bacterium]